MTRFAATAFVALAASCGTTGGDRPAPVPAEPAVAAPRDAAATAAHLVELFNRKDAAAVFALFDTAMQTAVPRDRVAGLIDGVIAHCGPLGEPTKRSGDARQGEFVVGGARGAMAMNLAIDPDGRVTGLGLHPADAAPPVTQSSIALALPFGAPAAGRRWSVAWGGDREDLNYHVGAGGSQRRAADLLVVDDGGKTFADDGRDNADFFAYGIDIAAVADGRVVAVIDGVPDNPPGELNPMFTPGNLIIVEHGPTLYSAYAHLIPSSARVEVGQQVRRGDAIARCGNSGNSSEPHLHFQLQDGPRFEKSWGIEPVFADVEIVRDGAAERAARYTWRRGDRIVAPSAPRR